MRPIMARRGTDILATVPSGESAKPEDIAEMVWLSSDRARYVTGAAYNADRGVMVRGKISAR
jgi:NAD(P)-dependent dehydrogenase (short-subunit alcohol dehydrogenase family)